MIPRRQHLQETTKLISQTGETVRVCLRPAHDQATCGTSTERRNSHGFPSLTKKLFAFGSHRERDNQFSLMQCHCEYQPYSRVGPNQDSLAYTKGAPCFSAHVLIGVF